MSLIKIISNHFSIDNLKTFCTDLDIDFDSLPGESKEAKVRELILYICRRGKNNEFLEALQKERPNVMWDEIPFPELSHDNSLKDYLTKISASYVSTYAEVIGFSITVPQRRESISLPQSFSYALLSILLGLIIQSFVPHTSFRLNDTLQATVIILAFWFFYSTVIHRVFLGLGGKGKREETISVCFQLLAGSYLVASFGYLLIVIFLQVTDLIPKLNSSQGTSFLFPAIELLILLAQLPRLLNIIHFPNEQRGIKYVMRAIISSGLAIIVPITSFFFFQTISIWLSSYTLKPIDATPITTSVSQVTTLISSISTPPTTLSVPVPSTVVSIPSPVIQVTSSPPTRTPFSIEIPIAANNLDNLVELNSFTLDSPLLTMLTSPDGTLTAVTSGDGIELYQTSNLSLIREWPIITDTSSPLVWSPDNRWLMVGDVEGRLLAWDRRNPSDFATVLESNSNIVSLAWEPGGESQWLAAGDDDELIYVWHVPEWVNPVILTGHTQAVTHLAWSPTEPLVLASGSTDDTGRIWDINPDGTLSGTERLTLSGLGTNVLTLAWSPDGQMVALQGFSVAMWWQASNGTQLDRRINVSAIAWWPDSSQIGLVVDNDIAVRTAGGNEAYFLRGHTGPITYLAFSPANPELLLSNGRDGAIRLWNITSQENIRTFPSQGEPFTQAAWSPDGQQIVTADNKNIHVWSVTSGEQLAQFPGHFQPRQIKWVSDTSVLTLGSIDNLVRLWDISSQQPLALLATHGDQTGVRAIIWSPDNRHLAILNENNVVHIWEVASNKIVQAISGHTIQDEIDGLNSTTYPVNDLAWSPDGAQLVTAGSDGTARIWDVSSGQELAVLSHDWPVWVVAWSPDGSKIATASSDTVDGNGEIQMWDSNGSRLLWDQDNTVINVANIIWSPDGSKIAVGGWAGSGGVQIWDATAASSLDWFALTDRTLVVGDLVWSADSARLITAARNEGTVHFWDATTFGNAINNFSYMVKNVYEVGIQQIVLLPPNEVSILSLSNNGELRVWQANENGQIEESVAISDVLQQEYATVHSTFMNKQRHLALSPDSTQLAVVTSSSTIKVLVIGS